MQDSLHILYFYFFETGQNILIGSFRRATWEALYILTNKNCQASYRPFIVLTHKNMKLASQLARLKLPMRQERPCNLYVSCSCCSLRKGSLFGDDGRCSARCVCRVHRQHASRLGQCEYCRWRAARLFHCFYIFGWSPDRLISSISSWQTIWKIRPSS